jgi:hypothetical protein
MRMAAPQLEQVSGKDASTRARSLAQRYRAEQPDALSSRVVVMSVSCAGTAGLLAASWPSVVAAASWAPAHRDRGGGAGVAAESGRPSGR